MFEFLKIFLGVTLVAAGTIAGAVLFMYSATFYPHIAMGALVFGGILAISLIIWSEKG